ncbi:unnamed protein product [Cuscuta europaea]|uniref:Uncharacterized protein n=1 Tax=Cuscuta europaea TaxID=41803 RepID=A0A9P0YXC4_CUSEU|nr:unnamed protein product [Cuscuta europaea]
MYPMKSIEKRNPWTCGLKKTEQFKASKSFEQNSTSQNTFLVFKVEARACYLCLLIGQSSRREDLVRACSILFLNILNMLMDIFTIEPACSCLPHVAFVFRLCFPLCIKLLIMYVYE